MTADSITISSLTPGHLNDLRALHADPRYALQPQRRKLLVRLGLIVPAEPKREAHDGSRVFRTRAHALTPIGLQLIGDDEVKRDPTRIVPGTQYYSQRRGR